jgi:hypothetical protein
MESSWQESLDTNARLKQYWMDREKEIAQQEKNTLAQKDASIQKVR